MLNPRPRTLTLRYRIYRCVPHETPGRTKKLKSADGASATIVETEKEVNHAYHTIQEEGRQVHVAESPIHLHSKPPSVQKQRASPSKVLPLHAR